MRKIVHVQKRIGFCHYSKLMNRIENAKYIYSKLNDPHRSKRLIQK